ncbi:hypothetical protein GOODEAATRI_003742 [Goodea atripinnis]|uniref:Uncharacterized protein n=1 Tax=Goodea atripinnis TaxID=208336 RepID=A0ABV0NUZ0_9TELE
MKHHINPCGIMALITNLLCATREQFKTRWMKFTKSLCPPAPVTDLHVTAKTAAVFDIPKKSTIKFRNIIHQSLIIPFTANFGQVKLYTTTKADSQDKENPTQVVGSFSVFTKI